MTIAKRLGFSDKQWEKCWWVSALGQHWGAFYIYARRKGDRFKKLWIGIHEYNQRIAVISSLDITDKQWNGYTQAQRAQIMEPLKQKFYETARKFDIEEVKCEQL